MGTQLLFIDIIDVVGLLKKQLRGCKMTEREKKKIKKTLVDFATLVPVIILMLLPVSLDTPKFYTQIHLFISSEFSIISLYDFSVV